MSCSARIANAGIRCSLHTPTAPRRHSRCCIGSAARHGTSRVPLGPPRAFRRGLRPHRYYRGRRANERFRATVVSRLPDATSSSDVGSGIGAAAGIGAGGGANRGAATPMYCRPPPDSVTRSQFTARTSCANLNRNTPPPSTRGLVPFCRFEAGRLVSP